jgi:hypothetical protein
MNTDSTKFILNSLGQNAERHEYVKTDDSSFTRRMILKRLGTTLKNNNSIIREIKSRWNSGYAYYHPVLNLMSSRLSFQIKIYRTLILLLYSMEVIYGR